MKNVVLKNIANSQQNICTRIFINKFASLASNFIKKETLAQVFSWEFCDIFKDIFLREHFWTTASVISGMEK